MNKTIDLTPIVGTQVLCEFWNSVTPDNPHIGTLDAIEEGGDLTRYKSGKYLSALNCRIYHHPDYWISNADGKLVLPKGVNFNYITKDGFMSSSITIVENSQVFRHWPKDAGIGIIAVQGKLTY